MEIDKSQFGEIKRTGFVYFHGEYCAIICEYRSGYIFEYDEEWIKQNKRRISASLPIEGGAKFSPSLFPFFVGMLSEGNLRMAQSIQGRIDESDDFGLLLLTCNDDTAGAVTVKSIRDPQ